MSNEYETEHAEIDAEAILEGPLCRTNYSATTRDNLAVALLRIVKRETGVRPSKNRPKRVKTRTGSSSIKGFRL